MKEVPDQLRKLRREYVRYQQAEIIVAPATNMPTDTYYRFRNTDRLKDVAEENKVAGPHNTIAEETAQKSTNAQPATQPATSDNVVEDATDVKKKFSLRTSIDVDADTHTEEEMKRNRAY